MAALPSRGGGKFRNRIAPTRNCYMAKHEHLLTFADYWSPWNAGFWLWPLDRVLGGGIVPGSLVLIGEIGVVIDTAAAVSESASARYRILYVCREESG